MVFNREEAAKRAESDEHNTPGMCQAWTDSVFGAPAVGDFDGNSRANAVDGWDSEHGHQHLGDRRPPRGVPVAYAGGSHGDGHRAVSLGNGKIRSTDANGEGNIATVDLDWPEKNWGLRYLGWSDTISGERIPMPPPPAPTLISEFLDGAPHYDLKLLDKAIGHGRVGYHHLIVHVRDEIVTLVHRLPGGEHDTRVQEFVDEFRKDRVLRMHLLEEAVKNGRTGTVKTVFDGIHRQINMLPKH